MEMKYQEANKVAIRNLEVANVHTDKIIIRGAFQPPTIDEIGHLRKMTVENGQITVVLESWKASRSLRTPFTAEERETLIRTALGALANQIRVVYLIDDFYGYRYDETQSLNTSALVWTDQSEVRDQYLRSGSLTGIAPENHVWLRNFTQSLEYEKLHEDRLSIDTYRESWKSAPYPPIFVTTDALVTKDDRVLMIRRGRAPGVGQLALPGGFIENHECLFTGVLRELEEETAFCIPGIDLRDRFSSVRVFDEPKRSARGRTITHVHHFALREADPEPVFKPGDDAAEVFWMRLGDIRECEVFEDHYQILQVFLKQVADQSADSVERNR